MNNQIVISSTIQEQVYQILRHDIINRAFRGGEQLKEAELAQRFNVSRSPVREALHRLAGDGMLTIIPNRGIFVKEFDEKYLIDILDMRSLLERRSIELCCEKMSDEFRAELMKIRSRMNELLESNDTDPDKNAELDTHFHHLIMEMNDNAFISEVAAKVSALSSMFMNISIHRDELALECQREHIAIIDAILEGDVSRATTAYMAHLDSTKKCVADEFSNQKQ